MSLSGGDSRELTESVCEADWSPDGTRLAVIRYKNAECHLEFPLGTELAHTNAWYSSVRNVQNFFGPNSTHDARQTPRNPEGTEPAVDGPPKRT